MIGESAHAKDQRQEPQSENSHLQPESSSTLLPSSTASTFPSSTHSGVYVSPDLLETYLHGATPQPFMTPQHSANPDRRRQSASPGTELAGPSNAHGVNNPDQVISTLSQSRNLGSRPSSPRIVENAPARPPQKHINPRNSQQAGAARNSRPPLPFLHRPTITAKYNSHPREISMRSPQTQTSSPASALSKTSDTTMLPPPSPRSKARDSGSLKLGNLPRFHPAKFQSSSTQSSTASTPTSAANSHLTTPQHQHNRRFSDASRQLQNYQRELVANATRAARNVSTSSFHEPDSPRLNPLGSPGPVTPLALESGDGEYLAAGLTPKGRSALRDGRAGEAQADLVERLIEEEARLRDRQADIIPPLGRGR
ncbi:MAG: hypothetical protein M4579_001176 [Chaenotheca gracillima]|nr:MAG: hypothetical protein M4579_001176 [Chaenotheca gracillima]